MSEVLLTQSLEWINSNMHRNYPIADGVVPQAVSGEYLPASFLVDLQMIVPYVEGLDASKFFVSSIVRQPAAFQLTIGYMIDTATGYGFDCAVSATIPLSLQFTGTSEPYAVQLAGLTSVVADAPASSYTHGIPAAYAALRGIRGTAYIASCVDMSGIGELSFLYANARLIPQCVYIESPISNVSSVRFLDDYGTDATFTNDITIKAEAGVTVAVDGQTITFSLDKGYMTDEVTRQMTEKFGSAITTLNGMEPDENGNFQIQGLDCTIVNTETSGIMISNPCAKPCCDTGNVDSAEIQTALNDLQTAKEVLNNYYMDLATKVNSMQARLSSLIASRG